MFRRRNMTQKSEKEHSLQWNLLAVISAEVIIPLFMLLKPINHCLFLLVTAAAACMLLFMLCMRIV